MRTRVVGIAIVAVVAAVAGTACGGAVPATSPPDASSAAPVVAHASATVAEVRPAAAEGANAVPAVVVTEPARGAAAGADSSRPAPASASASSSFSPAVDPLSATVAPSCAVANQPFAVTITSTPRASLALAVSFADDQTHGLMTFAEADEAGRFTWQLVAPADVPTGPATVLVASRDADGRDTGTTAAFSIAGRSCG